jgi:cyclopropane fatty-acyl-phospholipid synthase-like methyltransferase
MNETTERIRKNNSYYARFAEKVAERTENRDFSKALDMFLNGIEKNKLIVDIGSGAGIHLKYFNDQGFKTLGIEPSKRMRELASDLGASSIEGTFENLDSLSLKDVGGVWCAASLLHVPKENLSSVVQKISAILESNGRFYLTVRIGEGAKWDQWDDSSGDSERFIQLFSEDEITNSVKNNGFEVESSWIEDSYWGRPSKWISIIAHKT